MLLNMLGKLFEKVIANRLQWKCACFGLLHPCQFRGVHQNSTEDAGSYLTHLFVQDGVKDTKLVLLPLTWQCIFLL